MTGRAVLLPSVVAAVALLLATFFGGVTAASRYPEDAFGCDWFGYLRQARLFQQRGIIGGLDTAIRDDRTRYLVEVGRRIGAPIEQWDEGVAPHCHHYNAVTDRVILHYPPGTGFVFSWFPEGVQARSTFVAENLLVVGLLILVILASQSASAPLLAVVTGVVVLVTMYRYLLDWSIPLSASVLTVLGWLSVALAVAPTWRSRVGLAAALGFGLGLAVNIRIPNLFIAAGPLLVLSMSFIRRPSWRAFAVPFAAGLGMLAALTPVLTSNLINAGHPLSPTYNRADTSMPLFTWEMVSKAARFYFWDYRFSGGSILLAGLALGAVLMMRRRLHADVIEATSGAFVGLVLSLAFMLTHSVMIQHYLIPAAVFGMTTAWFGLISSENARARQSGAIAIGRGARLATASFAILSVLFVVSRLTMPLSPYLGDAEVKAMFEPQAIVWGDLGTGNVNYFAGRQAAKIPFVDRSLQERFIAEVARDGVPQYLMVDDIEMRDLMTRLSQRYRFRPKGTVFGYDVYAIEAAP